QSLSYGDLDHRSDALAARLDEAGVRRGRFVALMLPRSPDLIVAILAILKAGAGYVPIEPGAPASAIRTILDSSESVALLTNADLAEKVEAGAISILTVDGTQADLPTATPVDGGAD